VPFTQIENIALLCFPYFVWKVAHSLTNGNVTC